VTVLHPGDSYEWHENSTNNTDTPNDIAAEAPQNKTSCSKGDTVTDVMSGNNRSRRATTSARLSLIEPALERIVLADVDPDTSEHYKKKKHVEEELEYQRDRREITRTPVGEPAQPADCAASDGHWWQGWHDKTCVFKASIPRLPRLVIQKSW